MSRSRKLYISVIVFTLFFSLTKVSPGYSQPNSLFKLPLNARELGLGGTTTSLNSGKTEPFRNCLSSKTEADTILTSLYANQFEELHYTVLSLQSENASVSYQRLSSEKITGRNYRGEPTGNNFRYSSQGLQGEVHKSFGRTAFGIRGRVLQQSGNGLIGGSLSSEASYDISPIRVGVEFSNLLTQGITSSEVSASAWKKELTFGVGFEKDNFKAGFDIEAEFHERGVEPNGYRVGAEFWLNRAVAIRLGLLDRLKHTIGCGLRGDNVKLDYAYLWHEELPNSQFVSLGWCF